MNDTMREAAVRLLDVWDEGTRPAHQLTAAVEDLRAALLADADSREKKLSVAALVFAARVTGSNLKTPPGLARQCVNDAKELIAEVVKTVPSERPEMSEVCGGVSLADLEETE